MKKNIQGYLFLFLIAGVIVALDQFTKSLVRTQLNFAETWMPLAWLAPYARIVHWQNTGAAFGIFQGSNLILSALAVVVSGAIIYFFPRVPQDDFTLRLAMSMQLGGALGNLVDRVTIGQVTDFISVMNFPVFNIADSSISIGVVVLLIGVWLNDHRKPADPGQPAAPLEHPAGPGSLEDGQGE